MKSTTLAIVIAIIILGGTFYFVNTDSTPKQEEVATVKNNLNANNLPTNNVQVKQKEDPTGNVKIVDGKQIIEIQARGGYNLKMSNAKSGIPTIVRFITNNTFDCSASIRIPSLGISKMLPSVGNTDISVGSPQAGVLQGSCGMGMYRFAINFQS